MVSLKTIAEKCGVSTATVSKALNDQRDISEETKSRVRKTAEALGYFPNAAARALKTNRSYNIGVLFEEEAGSGLTHEYFSGVLNGLKVQSEKQGYDITFINTCFENRKMSYYCPLYTSNAPDKRSRLDLGGYPHSKKKKNKNRHEDEYDIRH